MGDQRLDPPRAVSLLTGPRRQTQFDRHGFYDAGDVPGFQAKAPQYVFELQGARRFFQVVPQIAQQLSRTGRPYQIKVYPGVDHAFHNDTGPRYNATEAEAAWIATINWFHQYVGAAH